MPLFKPSQLPAALLLLAGAISLCPPTQAADWPMWRFDAQRSAASPQQLPAALQPLWQQHYGPRQPAWDDPLNLDLMTYDRVFEPIVLGNRLFMGFNDSDKLLALDTRTGQELWRFYAEGPVRLPPVGWQGRVYFCSDDGYLYCVSAETGELQWKFDGAPNRQQALGNRRLISAWPARGGPVIRDGNVYFCASIWPFMGTFLYALDADTGEVRWVNDSTGAQFIKQPHSAPSFAGVAPQGALVATESLLIVPGGRSVPAVFDRGSGTLRYFELNAGGKGSGGSFVTADEKYFYVHTREKGTRAFHLGDGVKTAFMPNEPVLAEGRVYSAELVEGQAVVRAYGADDALLWQVAADGRGDLILAGQQLVAAGADSISIIQLPTAEREAEVVYSLPVAAAVERLLVADDKLFAITLEGHLLAFGPSPSAPEGAPAATSVAAGSTPPASPTAAATSPTTAPAPPLLTELLQAGQAEGYALWFGRADDSLLDTLVAHSPFTQLAVVDHDGQRVNRLRRQLDAAGRYGQITAHHATAEAFAAPPYVAHQLFVASDLATNLATEADAALIAKLYQSVRPYGGTLQLLAGERSPQVAQLVERLQLEQAEVELGTQRVIVRRVGALPGSADWTHQYGDVANTIKSNDQRVKLPLGVLWFGGSSNTDVLPRHGHGPPEQVVGGRLFIQGMNSLSARDVYTGRVLWKREFANLGTYDVYFDDTYEDVPLDPKYNQVHIPGANARGTNYVVTEDRIYLLEGSVCHALDPATGQTLYDFHLPTAAGEEEHWGYIGVYENVLIGGLGFAQYGQRQDLTFESDKELRSSRAGFGSKSLDRAASVALVGFDRHTGEQLWKVDAKHSFWHNGIVAGGHKIYCLDKNPQQIEDALRRRGQLPPDSYRILAIDYLTGQTQWEIQDGIFGTWLGYSADHDLLLQAGAKGSDRLYDEVAAGMAVYSASSGELQWKNQDLNYAGPCILHNDLIITNANSYTESAGAYYLKTGKQKMVKNPLTGALQPWRITRAYGCNSIIASENMLTFRSGAAGFYDLISDSGTGNLGGFKSGCTSNLVVANGVLNAPDYTRTCSCAYQNQTSLALVHMPDVDMWSVHSGALGTAAGDRIRQLGINFGAPGDRRDSEGLLWLEYPVMAEPAPPLAIQVDEQARFFQHHSSSVPEAEHPWIFASGVEGLSELRIALQAQEKPDEAAAAPASGADPAADPAAAPTAAEAPPAGLPARQYDLSLWFAAPPQLSAGLRVFDVYLDDQCVLENVTLDPAADGQANYVVHRLQNVSLTDELHLRFEAKQGQALISGVRLRERETAVSPGEAQ